MTGWLCPVLLLPQLGRHTSDLLFWVGRLWFDNLQAHRCTLVVSVPSESASLLCLLNVSCMRSSKENLFVMGNEEILCHSYCTVVYCTALYYTDWEVEAHAMFSATFCFCDEQWRYFMSQLLYCGVLYSTVLYWEAEVMQCSLPLSKGQGPMSKKMGVCG